MMTWKRAKEIIDPLSYHYPADSNTLLNVVDAANDPNSTLGDFKYAAASKTATTVDYTYDGNGNMVSDQNKKITQITYNILNLPGVITVFGEVTIKYYYDAAGNKLMKRTTDITGSPVKTTITTYIGGAVYQNDTLQFFGTPEGRIRNNTDSSGWIYDYFLKDHLGNARMMITDDHNVESPILEANGYYPFGLIRSGISLTEPLQLQQNKRLYNGKELQSEEFSNGSGLDEYDYGARFQDPQLGIRHNPDLLVNRSRGWYPYNYAMDTQCVLSTLMECGLHRDGSEYTEDQTDIQTFMQ